MKIDISPDIEKYINIEKLHEYLEVSENAWELVLLLPAKFDNNTTPVSWPEKWVPVIAVYVHAYPSGNAAYLAELLGIVNGDVYCWDDIVRFSRPTDEETFKYRGGDSSLARSLLPEILGNILFMLVTGNRRKEYLEGDESKVYGVPQVGNQFYIDKELYVSHPGSHSGGLVTITAVRKVSASYNVKVEEFTGVELSISGRGPSSWMGPKWLEKQELLKKRFSEQRARSVAFNDYEIIIASLDEKRLEKLFSNESEEPKN